jgi:hypothetical protein
LSETWYEHEGYISSVLYIEKLTLLDLIPDLIGGLKFFLINILKGLEVGKRDIHGFSVKSV